MKIIQLLILLSLAANLSCINKGQQINHKTNLKLVKKPKKIDKNVIWYQKEIIQDIRKIDEKKYRIQIGISAQIFYLQSKSENVFKILNYSFKNNKNIKIGIENNTNKILFANKLNE